jgi:hypothetical protein
MVKAAEEPRREADYSSTTNAEVKNTWVCTSTPPHVFMAWCLNKHKENLVLRNKQYTLGRMK